MWPLWNRAIEEYLSVLNPGWQITQLGRTLPPPLQKEVDYTRSHTEAMRGSTWGAFAYVLSSNGTQTVRNQFLCQSSSPKPTNAISSGLCLNEAGRKCPDLSADVCLLSLQPPRPSHVKTRSSWLSGKKKVLEEQTRAEPPFVAPRPRSGIHAGDDSMCVVAKSNLEACRRHLSIYTRKTVTTAK